MNSTQRVSFLTIAVGASLLLLLVMDLLASAASNGEYALGFDGVSDNVQLYSTASMMAPTWTTTKSVSVWIRPLGSFYCFVPEPGSCDAIFGDVPRWWGISRGLYNGNDRIWVWNVGTPGGFARIGIPYTVGEWMHVTMVHSNGRLRAYKNGVLVNDILSGATEQPPGLPVLYFGGLSESSNPYFFEGEMDELQLWNVALTPAEIRQNMYRSLTGSEPGLAAYYRMSNGSGLLVTDDSVNNWNGTLRDGWPGCGACPPDSTYPQWSVSGTFVGPRNTLDFDGVDDFVDIANTAAAVIGSGWPTDKSGDVWVKPTSAGLAAANASQGEWIFGGPNWGISQATIDGEDRLWVWNNDGNEDRIGLTYTPGEWIHVTLVHSGGRLTAYRDTILAGSSPSGSTVADGNLTVGGLVTGQAFAGQIDELRLWDDARSLLEVQSYVYQTAAFDEAGLRAYYRFDQQNQAGQTEVVDSSNYGHQATMINMTPTTDWLPSTAFNTWVGSGSQAWNDGGNWSRNTTTNHNVAITRYSGSYAATITTSTAVTNVVVVPGANLVVSDSLTINGNLVNLGIIDAVNLSVTAGASLEMHSGGAMTVTGLLQNSGALKQTQTVDGSGVVGFFNTGGYGGLTIDSGGQNLGETAVIIRGNQQCTTVINETALRCFNITPEIAPAVGISMTFAFADSELPITMDCNLVNIFHWGGGVWTEITPTVRNCSQPVNYITVENVVTFSPFVIGQIPNTPTAVALKTISVSAVNNWLVMAVVITLLFFTCMGLIWHFRRREKGIV